MIKLGIIGCGYIASKHVETISSFKEIRLAAVSDIIQDKMVEVLSKYNKNHSNNNVGMYSNYKDLLKSDVDVVVISVISGLHSIIAKEALLSNKHVILEKPIALTIQEARELVSIAKEKEIKLLLCHQLRYLTVVKKIKEYIDKGQLGVPYLAVASVRINRDSNYYASASWRGTWEHDGGMLINQGIHLIDLLVWLLGDVTKVYGEISNKNTTKETEDIALGIINFKNGAKGVIEANSLTKPKNQGYYLSLFFQNGTILIGGEKISTVHHSYIEEVEGTFEDLTQLSLQQEEHHLMYKDFIQAIQTKNKAEVEGSDVIPSLEAIFGLYTSHLQGMPISMPIDKFSTKNMNGIN